MLYPNKTLIAQFEEKFLPYDQSTYQGNTQILGFGEISTVIGFIEGENSNYAFKRIPLFDDAVSAEAYCLFFERYNQLLLDVGLNIPDYKGLFVPGRKGKFTIYLAQKKLDSNALCNRLIHQLSEKQALLMIEQIFFQMKKVWLYKSDEVKIGLDGQLSNWALKDYSGSKNEINESSAYYYLDTSTPFINENGIELLDKRMFMKSAPLLLRPVLYLLAKGIIERYYDIRSVIVDLLANLIKEKKKELMVSAIPFANTFLKNELPELNCTEITEKEISKYYAEDKFTWDIYLRFRYFDKWLKTKIFNSGYEFLLPGKIDR